MVFFQSQRPQVPERSQAEQSGDLRVLESHRNGQADSDLQRKPKGRREESSGFLRRQTPKRGENQLDYARVSARQRRQFRRRPQAS